jgi:hypothetical protein
MKLFQHFLAGNMLSRSLLTLPRDRAKCFQYTSGLGREATRDRSQMVNEIFI